LPSQSLTHSPYHSPMLSFIHFIHIR
jgi:hypothetical protein